MKISSKTTVLATLFSPNNDWKRAEAECWLSDAGWAPTHQYYCSPGKHTGGGGILEHSLHTPHKPPSASKALCSSKQQSTSLKWQPCSWYKPQGDAALRREAGTRHQALPFAVLMENHFCTHLSTQQDPFPSSPLPSTHSLKIHTNSHTHTHTQAYEVLP